MRQVISNLLKSKRNKQILTGDTPAMPLSPRYAHFGGFFRAKAGNHLLINGQKVLHLLQHWPILLLTHLPCLCPPGYAQIGGFFYAWRNRA